MPRWRRRTRSWRRSRSGCRRVYIGALRNDPLKVKEVLGLPDGCMGVFGMCVGYAAAEAANEVKPRLPQPAVLFCETYSNAEAPALRAAYDEKMAAFSQRNEMAQDSWTARVINHMGKIGAMNGRDRLAGILRAMGFLLR